MSSWDLQIGNTTLQDAAIPVVVGIVLISIINVLTGILRFG
jgi:hypothetical protein